eukprot:SAG11_NODE_563_length_8516_cov_11.669122_9_plen_66_part_00
MGTVPTLEPNWAGRWAIEIVISVYYILGVGVGLQKGPTAPTTGAYLIFCVYVIKYRFYCPAAVQR